MQDGVPHSKIYEEFPDCNSGALNHVQPLEAWRSAGPERSPIAGPAWDPEWSLPSLTIDVGAPQGVPYLSWREGDAHKQQDVAQALCVHLAMAIEDLKVTAEGCSGAAGVT